LLGLRYIDDACQTALVIDHMEGGIMNKLAIAERFYHHPDATQQGP
jgi:hypothetical protein